MNLQTILSPPPPSNWGGTATCNDYPDYIKQLGDQIAGLTLLEGQELIEYLNMKKEQYEKT